MQWVPNRSRDLPGHGSEDRDLRTVPRSCKAQGLDLSGVGPASGPQKGGKEHEFLFWEVTYFHSLIIKVRQCLEKSLEETLKTINRGYSWTLYEGHGIWGMWNKN